MRNYKRLLQIISFQFGCWESCSWQMFRGICWLEDCLKYLKVKTWNVYQMFTLPLDRLLLLLQLTTREIGHLLFPPKATQPGPSYRLFCCSGFRELLWVTLCQLPNRFNCPSIKRTLIDWNASVWNSVLCTASFIKCLMWCLKLQFWACLTWK